MPFRSILGHRHIVRLIARSIARKSLPPSLIFAGPSGVGKRLTALAAAEALNCTNTIARHESAAPDETQRGQPNDISIDACGVCHACTRIARGIHPDVLILEPGDSGWIRTEQVRDVIDRAGYRPFEGRRRVVIIDDADALFPVAQNALLKTLEEPPSSSMFVLVTSRPDVLLPTVLSRCPRLRFRPLGVDDIVEALVARGESDQSARAVAAASDGSLGRAVHLRGDELLGAREVAQQVLISAAAADAPRRRIESAKDLLANTGRSGAEDRAQVALHLRAMASLLRDVELLGNGFDARGLVDPDLRPVLERLTSSFKGERGVRAFEAVDQALVALERNASVKIVADWLVLQL